MRFTNDYVEGITVMVSWFMGISIIIAAIISLAL